MCMYIYIYIYMSVQRLLPRGPEAKLTIGNVSQNRAQQCYYYYAIMLLFVMLLCYYAIMLLCYLRGSPCRRMYGVAQVWKCHGRRRLAA